MLKRSGVSLLEVMFSIGVVVIGLLGVMLIVPFGLSQVGRGNIADRSARAGLNAVEAFEVRGMRRPDVWIHADGTPVQDPARFPGFLASHSPSSPSPPYLPIGFSYCIDPRFLASTRNLDSSGLPLVQAAGVSPYFDARLFPYYSWAIPTAASGLPSPPPPPASTPPYLFNDVYQLSPSGGGRVVPFLQNRIQPRMIRISLKTAAGVPLAIGPNVSGSPFNPNTANNSDPVDLGARMGLVQADRIFVPDDDLMFDAPKEKQLAAIQKYRWTVGPDGRWGVAGSDDDGDLTVDNQNEQGWPGSDDVPIRREFESDFSWFATLVPRQDANGSFSGSEYTLSIVVLHHLNQPAMFDDLNANGNYDAGEETRDERVVSVATLDGAGYAGGDVILEASNVLGLDLVEDEWVMLSGSAGVAGTEAPDFRWYRVVTTEKEPEFDTVTSTYKRVATLQGSDWQRTEWMMPTTDIRFRPTQATIVKGAVAVYEKTIQLENTVAYPQ